MEVVVKTGAIRRAKLQSTRHHQQTNTQVFSFYRSDALPDSPANSVRALSGNYAVWPMRINYTLDEEAIWTIQSPYINKNMHVMIV